MAAEVPIPEATLDALVAQAVVSATEQIGLPLSVSDGDGQTVSYGSLAETMNAMASLLDIKKKQRDLLGPFCVRSVSRSR